MIWAQKLSKISPQRSANLNRLLFEELGQVDLRIPRPEESEPRFTRLALAPLVRRKLETLTGLHFQFRGDGGNSQSVPASALGIPFFPDLAVSYGHQHLWAAEVKILRRSNRQNAIATALGQATLYKSRYEHVTVILIDTFPVDRLAQRKLVEDAKEMDLNVIIRSRVGNSLLHQDA